MKRERQAWKEPLLWLTALVAVAGLGLAIEAKAVSLLVEERAIAGGLQGLRERIEPQVVGFFNSLIAPDEMRELQWLEESYGLGLPDLGQEAAKSFDSGWRAVVQTISRGAATLRNMLASAVRVGLLVAFFSLVLVAVIDGWVSLGEQVTGVLLANGASCLLVYVALAVALGRAEQTAPARAVLVARQWVQDFLGFQLSVGIPFLVLGGAGILLLYLLSPKPSGGARPPLTSRTARGPRA